jgi:hypothetical protein
MTRAFELMMSQRWQTTSKNDTQQQTKATRQIPPSCLSDVFLFLPNLSTKNRAGKKSPSSLNRVFQQASENGAANERIF